MTRPMGRTLSFPAVRDFYDFGLMPRQWQGFSEEADCLTGFHSIVRF
jgi:hypothetical protein